MFRYKVTAYYLH